MSEAVDTLLAGGDAAGALALTGRLLEAAPDDQALLELRARCLEVNGEWDQAMLLRRRLLDAAQSDAAVLALAEAQLAAGDAEDAAFTLECHPGDGRTALQARIAYAREPRWPPPEATPEELAAGADAWWNAAAAANAVPAWRIVPGLRERLDAGDPAGAVSRYAAFASPPSTNSAMATLADAVAELGAREAVRRCAGMPASVWGRVVDRLIRSGAYDTARALVASVDDEPLRRRLAPLLGVLPAEDRLPGPLRRASHRRPATLRITAPGAQRAVIVLGASTSTLLHAHLAARNVDVIHLRDVSRMLFLGGIRDLAPDWNGTIAALRELAFTDGARRLHVVGASGPGYAAIRMGLDIGADSVLALAPPTDTSERAMGDDPRGRLAFGRVRQVLPAMLGDLRPELETASAPPVVHLWYSGAMARDAAHARHLEGLPCVRVRELAHARRHNVLLDLTIAGRVDEAVDAFLSEDDRADAGAIA